MNLFWLFSILLFIQPVTSGENLVLTYQGNPISSASREEYTNSIIDIPVIDEDKLSRFVNYLDEQIYKKPENATINKSGVIIKEQVGVKLNRDKFINLFYTFMLNQGPSTAEIPTQSIYPKVDSELLSTIRTKQIGKYITHFNSSNKERSTNISIAAAAINNHVVFPNETFSFNAVVGKRTTTKGYLPAPEIVKGELIEGIGGGICQVSSTLFNAVDQAGVKIVERYSHSRSVPYVPSGRDATVSWYGPDFTFRNTYNQPILIRTRVSGGSLIVSVYSSEDINVEPRDTEGIS